MNRKSAGGAPASKKGSGPGANNYYSSENDNLAKSSGFAAARTSQNQNQNIPGVATGGAYQSPRSGFAAIATNFPSSGPSANFSNSNK